MVFQSLAVQNVQASLDCALSLQVRVLCYGAGQSASLDSLDVVRRCVEVKYLYLAGETALLNRLDSALTHLSVYSPNSVYFRVGGQHVLHNVERFVAVALCSLGCNNLEAAALILKALQTLSQCVYTCNTLEVEDLCILDVLSSILACQRCSLVLVDADIGLNVSTCLIQCRLRHGVVYQDNRDICVICLLDSRSQRVGVCCGQDDCVKALDNGVLDHLHLLLYIGLLLRSLELEVDALFLCE